MILMIESWVFEFVHPFESRVMGVGVGATFQKQSQTPSHGSWTKVAPGVPAQLYQRSLEESPAQIRSIRACTTLVQT